MPKDLRQGRRSAPRSYRPQYAKIRRAIHEEYGAAKDNIFRWQNLCREMNIQAKASELRKWAKAFGIPPQYWNHPREICALITPRVDDFRRKVACDNEDEYTMDGDAIVDIPEFLKYSHVDPRTGKQYCYNVFDLYKSYKAGQRGDPYRRFTFTDDVIDDITDRVDFIRKAIEPRGYGEGVMNKIRDTRIATLAQELRAKLVWIWSKLHYPKLTLNDMLSANEATLNGIMASMERQVGLDISDDERWAFRRARTANEKRELLIDLMDHIVNGNGEDNSVVLVALERAINGSNPRGEVGERAESESDELALEGDMRATRARGSRFHAGGLSSAGPGLLSLSRPYASLDVTQFDQTNAVEGQTSRFPWPLNSLFGANG